MVTIPNGLADDVHFDGRHDLCHEHKNPYTYLLNVHITLLLGGEGAPVGLIVTLLFDS